MRNCIFFLADYIQSHFLLTFGRLDIILIFFNSCKIRISVFYMREHIELVDILQNRVEMGIVYFFWQILFREILLLTLGCLDNIYIFFDSRKFRILVFYVREHIELVYIFQNRIEKVIVHFFWQIIFRAILLSTVGCLDNIEILFDSCKIKISVFSLSEHTELVYILQNRVE